MPSNDKMRAEFEEYLKREFKVEPLRAIDSENYHNATTLCMYLAWQSAYTRGMQRAAEICEKLPPQLDTSTGEWYPNNEQDCAAAIRAEIEL